MLLMLVEQLTNAGIEVISANTDGVTTYVDVNKIGVVQQVCDN
jgi:hypothetical protein